MNWILDNLQIVLLLLVGVGSLVKTVLDAKAKETREREQTTSSEPDKDYSRPKRRVIPAIPPPLKQAGYDDAVATETAQALKHQRDLAERLRQIRNTKATTTGGAAATRERIASKGVAKSSKQVLPGIRTRLRDPGEVRRAIVMREILGPPVGLR